MDFSEQDVDVFGEDYDVHDGGAEAEAEGGGDSSGSSSPSSSSSSSAAASSSSSSGASSRSSSGAGGEGEDGADEGDGEELDSSNIAGTRGTGAGPYRDDERGEDEDDEVEEERDLFGSDNEDYVRTPARSNYLVPGPSHANTKLGASALGPRLNSSSFCRWFSELARRPLRTLPVTKFLEWFCFELFVGFVEVRLRVEFAYFRIATMGCESKNLSIDVLGNLNDE